MTMNSKGLPAHSDLIMGGIKVASGKEKQRRETHKSEWKLRRVGAVGWVMCRQVLGQVL